MNSTTTAPSPVVAPIAAIFKTNDGLIAKALDGLSPADLQSPLTSKNNSILWLAGHVTETRASLLRSLGEPADTGWGKLFSRGAALEEVGRYPSIDEIHSVSDRIGRQLHAKLDALDDSQLAKPANITLPNTKTIADQIAFFSFHESYHVGQVAYVRKGLGYSQIAG
ncbi:MAG: DinB family protein [Terracidiphilus sp.]|jgi:uncharacterized damage-inducible protein DinB